MITQPRGIYGFFNEYRWLSNFYPCEISYRGLVFPSTENAYQAMKTTDSELQKLFVDCSPNKSKKLGRSIEIRKDWDCVDATNVSVKDKVMLDLLRIKYNIPEFDQRLLATEDLYLEETNWWGDKYWGVCNGEGLNKLGLYTMTVRMERKSVKDKA